MIDTVRVPKEPTLEMLKAGASTLDDFWKAQERGPTHLQEAWPGIVQIYAAMLAASPQGEGSSADAVGHRAAERVDVAWLVESQVSTTPNWWDLKYKWTGDASKAIRFSREIDADAFIDFHCLGPVAKATEHLWQATPPAMSADHIGEATNIIAPMEAVAYAWASEWTGVGGHAHALHTTEQEAVDNAEWMNGRVLLLYTDPVPMEAVAWREALRAADDLVVTGTIYEDEALLADAETVKKFIAALSKRGRA